MDGKAILIGIGLIALGGFLAFLLLGNRSVHSLGVAKRAVAVPVRQYTNKEEWDISWSAEGLPTKVVIHRKAQQT